MRNTFADVFYEIAKDDPKMAVIVADIELRTGTTWYTQIGDGPLIVLVVGVGALAWWPAARRRRASAVTTLVER